MREMLASDIGIPFALRPYQEQMIAWIKRGDRGLRFHDHYSDAWRYRNRGKTIVPTREPMKNDFAGVNLTWVAYDEIGEIDERIMRALNSKADIHRRLSHGEEALADEAPHVWAQPGRLDGRCYRARPDAERDPGSDDGQQQGAQSREEPLWPPGFVDDPHRSGEVRKSAPSLGEEHKRGAMSILEIKVVDQSGGAVVHLKAGSSMDYQGYPATAPEIDRLIAELGRARDQARAKNRPSAPFWKRPY